MSDIGLILNGLLGVLLIGALAMGWRLEGRLKALRASHQSFAQAVGDLDRAAARAEQGLADLRAATDEATETLAGRIERAKSLSVRLEKLTEQAGAAEARLQASPRAAASTPAREGLLARLAERLDDRAAASAAHAQRPVRADLILGEEDEAPAPAKHRLVDPSRLDRLRALAQPRAAGPKGSRRSDEELFDAPPQRRIAGAVR